MFFEPCQYLRDGLQTEIGTAVGADDYTGKFTGFDVFVVNIQLMLHLFGGIGFAVAVIPEIAAAVEAFIRIGGEDFFKVTVRGVESTHTYRYEM